MTTSGDKSKFHWNVLLKLLRGHGRWMFAGNGLARICHSRASFSDMWTVNFQMFKLDLEKAEKPEIKLPTSAGSWKKQESSRKTSISALLTMPKPLTEWITRNCGKFWKRWEYQTTRPASWEICMQFRKQQLDWTWNNRLVPNRKRSMSRQYTVTLLI